MKNVIKYVPASIDWKKIQRKLPLPSRISTDDLNYFLGYIVERIEFDNELDFGDTVPVHSDTMKKVLSSYHIAKDYLIAANIIETNNHYTIGKKSKKYRITQEYAGAVRPAKITEQRILSRISKMKNLYFEKGDLHNKLLRQFFSKHLTIDMVDIEAQYSEIVNNFLRFEPNFTKLNSLLLSATKIHSQDFYFIMDETSGRLHTNITNLKSEARGYLRYKNRQLGSCDISCSQPYLLGGLLYSKMYSSEHKFMRLCLNRCSKKTREILYSNFQKLSQEIELGIDFDEYIQHVTDGSFYEFFLKELNSLLKAENQPEITKVKLVKKKVISIFYCNKCDYDRDYLRSKLVEIFKSKFPTVFDAINIMKAKNHKVFPRCLQAMESEIILGNIAIECVNRGMKPIFTIHDSVVSQVKNLPRIEIIMRRKLQKTMGLKPILKLERWEPKQLIHFF